MLDQERAARETVRNTISADRFDVLERFIASLRSWGAVTNLVSAADRERLWSRHVADSLQLAVLAGDGPKTWIDIGSGAGFPGLVVAIARPETAMTLVESNRKKAAFLLRAAADCPASLTKVTVKPVRAESLRGDGAGEKFDVVSARALAPLHKLLPLAAPFFGPSTVGLFPKGRDADSEIDAVSAYRFALERTPSRTDPDGTVLAVRNLQRA